MGLDPREIAGSLAQKLAQAIEQAEEPSNDIIIGDLDKQWAEAEKAQKDQERLWRENIAFLEGIQWLQSMERGILNMAGRTRKGRTRVTDNRLLDHARRLHARLEQVRYAPAVAAETEDQGDRKAAKAAHGALRWFYRRKKVSQEKRRADWWLVACGICYLEPYFDPSAGQLKPLPVIERDEQGKVVTGDDGRPKIVMEPAIGDRGEQLFDEVEQPDPTTGEPIPTQVPRMRPKLELQPVGEVDFVVRSPFAVKRDPRFQERRLIRWVFVEEVAAREEVIARFGDAYQAATGKDLEKELPSDSKINPLPWVPEIAPESQDITGLPKPSPTVSGTVTLRRYYERPSRKHKKGRHLIYVAGTKLILHKEALDTPDGDLPPVPLNYLERPWVLEGMSPVSAAKALQRLYNRILSRFGEHLIRLPAGWLLVPNTSGIPKNAFNNEIGSVIRFSPGGGKPEFVFPPFGQGLAWYDRFMMRLEASMEERMALPPATRGQMPKGAKAARTVQLLQEAADVVQTPVLGGIGDGYINFYEKVLGYMHRHYTIGRMISIQGPDKVAEAMEFKGDLLPRDWRDRLAVSVEMGESLPSSRLAKLDFILTLARDHGFFGQVGTPEYIRRLRGALDLDAGFIQTDEDLDVTIAEEENLAMLHDGQPLPIRPIDDDWVHLSEHLTFIKRMIAAGREGDVGLHMQHANLHWAQFEQKRGGAPQPADGSTEGGAQAAKLQRLNRMRVTAEPTENPGNQEVLGQEAQDVTDVEEPPAPPEAAPVQ